jgi:hypothetical protein
MWVKGSKIPTGRGWKVINKASVANASPNTVAIAAATKQTVSSSGIPLTLLPRQALRVRRYLSSIVQVAADNTVFVQGGEMGLFLSPFALANGVVLYPTMNEIAVPTAAGSTGSVPLGQTLADTAVNGTLIDDWIEFDDVATDAYLGSFQLKSFWYVWNSSAGVKSVTVGERLTYEVYEIPLISFIRRRRPKV